MRIGYISRVLPVLSETFVTSEMRAVAKEGFTVVPFSVHPPQEGSFQENARDIFEKTQIINNPFNPVFWLSHFQTLFSKPVTYFSTLFRYVFKPRLSLRNRLRAFSQFMLAPRAAQLFRRNKIEHIHAHFAHVAAGIAMMAGRLAGIPFSFTVHAYGLFADNMLLAEKIRDAAFVATVSDYNIDFIQEHYPEAVNNRPHLVRCSVDSQAFAPDQRKPASMPLVVSVGRLVPMKGFHTLIEACAVLVKEFPTLQCHIVGSGPLQESLEKQIHQLGLMETVHLKGKMMQEELRNLLNAAWVFALPSCIRESSDNLPVALMESLAMEIPTVSTRVRAIPELIIDGETGLLIDPDETSQLADAIRNLITDKETAVSLARRGREFVIKEFNAKESARRLIRLFKTGGNRLEDGTINQSND